MYCILKNTCKYQYKCCNYCKQKCEQRCSDNCESCRFFTKTEPCVSYKFTVNGQQFTSSLKKETNIKKSDPQLAKNELATKISIKPKKREQFIKVKKKKSLI